MLLFDMFDMFTFCLQQPKSTTAAKSAVQINSGE